MRILFLTAALGLLATADRAEGACVIQSVTGQSGGALVATICGPEHRRTVRRCDMLWQYKRWNTFCGVPAPMTGASAGNAVAGVMRADWQWRRAGDDVLAACSSTGGPLTCYKLRITGDTTSMP